jgi:hypothetical protein
MSSWSDEISWVDRFLKDYLVELTVLKLHFTFLTLVQKLVDFVALTVEVAVAYSEVTEDCFETCFHSELCVSENGEESVINHAPKRCFIFVPWFIREQIVTAVVRHWNEQSPLIKYLFVSKNAWIQSWNDRVFGFDDRAKSWYFIYVLMEVDFVFGIVLIEESRSDYPALDVLLNVLN